MIKSNLKHCVLLGGAMALIGLAACSGDDALLQQPQAADSVAASKIVSHAYVSVSTGEGAATRADVSDNTLNWQVGDKVVAYSNGQVNGTLVCDAVDATSGKATFKGELSNFAPASVNLFFLGNRSVSSGRSLTVDFSSQNGSTSGLVGYLFLAKTGVVFEELGSADEDGLLYKVAEDVVFEALTSIMELTLSGDGTPSPSEYKAKSVKVAGLQNQLTVNFATGEVTTGQTNDEGIITVRPTSAANYADTYYMAVIPSADNNEVSMTIAYQDGGTGSKVVTLSNLDWSSMAEGSSYFLKWDEKDPMPVSTKSGYNGASVDGSRGDGQSTKNGYNGQNADGTMDDPTGSKSGYNGAAVVINED